MSMNPRRQRHLRKKIVAYILLIGILSIAVFFLDIFFYSKKPLFISPIGRISTDLDFVKKNLKDKDILFSDVALSDYSYLISIPNNGQIRLSLGKDVGEQLSSLQRILKELTIEGKSFKSIDFRFSEPIISF